MKTQKVTISSIKANPNNPRIIKDNKFKKLVASIKEFPEMLEIRPIVVNADMVVLGGNMRLKACKEAGMKEIPIIMADDLTEAQQREFIIKDNVGFGEWDYDMLANEWEQEDLYDWGVDVPEYKKDDFVFTNPETSDRYTYELPEDAQMSHVRMVQLFLTSETEPLFRRFELFLRPILGTDNLTDTIYTAIKQTAEEKGINEQR